MKQDQAPPYEANDTPSEMEQNEPLVEQKFSVIADGK
jgi:hypothetical protein